MNEALLKKMRYKEGAAAVINPPEGYHLGIEAEGGLADKYEFIQLFVKNSQELMEWLPNVFPLLKDDALFWITYPKKSSKVKTDINRDTIFEILQKNTEFRVVSSIAVDEIWSALRVRHQSKVKAKSN